MTQPLLARRRKPSRRREGAAMLVVMILITLATVSALISVQSTTSEMNAAGRERILLHTRYAAEAAMISSQAYWDMIAREGSFLDTWNAWQRQPPPEVRPFTGGHAIPNTAARHMAARSTLRVQSQYEDGPNVPPVSAPNPGATVPDPTGSFGPTQLYASSDPIVDITDCFEAPASFSPGGQVGQGTSGLRAVRFYCTLTLRGRVLMENGGAGVSWDLPGGLNAEFQDRTGGANDTRINTLMPTVHIPK